ncbi:MAG: hypothetical protein QXY18_01060 [Nitrososphaerota archaeon]
MNTNNKTLQASINYKFNVYFSQDSQKEIEVFEDFCCISVLQKGDKEKATTILKNIASILGVEIEVK